MRIITYQCDFCQYEKTVYVTTGMQVPRVLWTYGKLEACDVCSDKVRAILDKELHQKLKIKENNHDDF